MSRLIDADALYKKACDLEAQAIDYTVKISNDEEKRDEWLKWSAILAERTAFKYDVNSAPTIKPEPQWIPCGEMLPDAGKTILISDGCEVLIGYYSGGNRWTVDGCEYDPILEEIAWMPLPKPYGGEQDERSD